MCMYLDNTEYIDYVTYLFNTEPKQLYHKLRAYDMEFFNWVSTEYHGNTLSEKLYCYVNNIDGGTCIECNTAVKFLSVTKGYRKYCSVKCMSNSRKIKDKKKHTCITKYGVDHYSKTDDYHAKFTSTNQLRYGVDNPGQIPELLEARARTKQETFFLDLCERVSESVTPNFAFSEYTEVRAHMPWRCLKCNKEFTSHVFNRDPVCPLCYPTVRAGGVSVPETELAEFVQSNYTGTMVRSTRSVITPYELDMYFPDKGLAIEFNGSYWHSENQGKGKQYHLNKTNMCNKHNIHLIHIWAHDWDLKTDIVKSRILSKLGTNRTIYGRCTSIRSVDHVEATQFLTNSHIQGVCMSSVRYGLYYDDVLVALMTFGKSRYKKDIEWELIRYCSALGTNVVGGAGKLFKHFIKTHTPTSVISYSDRMWNTGGLYSAIGFTYSHNTSPAYYYTRNYTLFENRVAYQKHKLQDKLAVFDPNLTEWQNMQANGFDRIWDCGNDVWVWKR